MDVIKTAQGSGVITKTEAKHIENQIDGGQSARDRQEDAKAQESAKKPTPADNTKSAMDIFSNVKAETTEAADGTRISKIEASDPKGGKSSTLAKVEPPILPLKQNTTKTCWAFAATMMINWYINRAMFPEEAMAQAGQDYVDKVKNNQGLKASEKQGLIDALKMVTEGKASFPPKKYVELMRTYGPIWVTIDSSAAEGFFSPHAKILVQIDGDDDQSGLHTFLTFVDPATGRQEAPQKFHDFLKVFEQVASDNPDKRSFSQIVHFKQPIAIVGEGYKFEGSLNIGTPVHEHITLAALNMSGKMKLPPGTTLESSASNIKEILRGLEGMYRLALDPPTATTHMEDAALQSLTIENSNATVGQPDNGTGTKYSWARWFDPTTFPTGSQSFRKLLTDNERPQGPEWIRFLRPNDQYRHLIMQRRALGSMLHLMQDSYARGHCLRVQDPASMEYGPIERFHTYLGQDEDQHAHWDKYNGRMDPFDITTFAPIHGAVEAIEASAAWIDLWAHRKDWEQHVKPFFLTKVFQLSPTVKDADTGI
ncbi:MAG: hypothetical protein Q9208_004615 [Pyrenodesmia sp. 3 TL-2023]